MRWIIVLLISAPLDPQSYASCFLLERKQFNECILKGGGGVSKSKIDFPGKVSNVIWTAPRETLPGSLRVDTLHDSFNLFLPAFLSHNTIQYAFHLAQHAFLQTTSVFLIMLAFSALLRITIFNLLRHCLV